MRWIARRLASVDVVDEHRGERIADLSWPRIVTGFTRMSQQTADVAMVGLAIGPAAIAGLAFASLYWGLQNSLVRGLIGGTVSQVSQRFGAGDADRVDVAIKQSLWIGLGIAIPFAICFTAIPEFLIGILSSDVGVVSLGAAYLQVLSLAIVFNWINGISERVLAGADNTWIPMAVRSTGAVLNIVLNLVFIFGLGMGVVGAALGTVCAEVAVSLAFVWGFLGREVPGIGEFPVAVRLGPPYFDWGTTRQLLSISLPLMVRFLGQYAVRFPILAIVGVFGPVFVAAYEVSRRIRSLMNAPAWGFSLSASSLVGQELGIDDEAEAEAYGWDVLRMSTVVYASAAALVVVFAHPITSLFVQDPEVIARTVPFVRVGALSAIALGIDSTATGALQASGDTRWPMYGKYVGLYVFMVPIAFLGTVTPLGHTLLYLAILVETAVPAAVSFVRFQSGAWKETNRRLRSSVAG